MGYYIRVLSRQSRPVPVRTLEQALKTEGLGATVVKEDEDDDEWESLELAHPDGSTFAVIDRTVVAPSGLGAEELQEFIDEVPEYRPSNAADWLVSYLPGVQAIYAIQILRAADQGDGWAAIHRVQSVLWNAGPGILQADGEGFSNEDGYHIPHPLAVLG